MLITISSIVSGQLFQLAAQNQRVKKHRGDRKSLIVTKYLLCLMSNDKEMQIDIHKGKLAGAAVGEDREIAFREDFPPLMATNQIFFTGTPSPAVKIAV